MAGKIVVLKNVFAAEVEKLLQLRQTVFDWALATEPLDQPDPLSNCHCLQAGVSKLQETPHLYHSFNFNRISQMPPDPGRGLSRYFTPLAKLQNAITGNSAGMETEGSGPMLHPQIIQYPVGGGFFGRHHHPPNPQRIGLIVALSSRGVDHSKGSAGFDVEGTVIDLEPHHDFGDIVLFRCDFPHWVNQTDPKDKFNWNSVQGRWTMVLPYY
jgi:hypothetical protein